LINFDSFPHKKPAGKSLFSKMYLKEKIPNRREKYEIFISNINNIYFIRMSGISSAPFEVFALNNIPK